MSQSPPKVWPCLTWHMLPADCISASRPHSLLSCPTGCLAAPSVSKEHSSLQDLVLAVFSARNALLLDVLANSFISFICLLKTAFCNEWIPSSITNDPPLPMNCQFLLPNSTFPPISLANTLDHLFCFLSIFYCPLLEHRPHKSRILCLFYPKFLE